MLIISHQNTLQLLRVTQHCREWQPHAWKPVGRAQRWDEKVQPRAADPHQRVRIREADAQTLVGVGYKVDRRDVEARDENVCVGPVEQPQRSRKEIEKEDVRRMPEEKCAVDVPQLAVEEMRMEK